MPISPDILKRLQENDPTLTVVDLPHDRMLDIKQMGNLNATRQGLYREDGIQLAKALRSNTHLEYLNLANNYIFENVFIILAALENNKTLKVLNIHDQVSGADSLKLLKALRKTNIMWLGAASTYDNFEIVKKVKPTDVQPTNNRAIRIKITDNQTVYPLKPFIDEILLDESITNLSLDGYKCLNEENCSQIARLLENHKKIRALGLHAGYSGNKGLKKIIPALKKNNTLTRLDLGLNEISDEGIDELAKLFETNKTLTALNLSANTASDAAYARLINAMEASNIKELNFFQCYNLGKNTGSAIASFLARNQSCEKLILSNTHIRYCPDELNSILIALQQNTHLLHLDLSWSFAEGCMPALAKALRNNKTLKKLELQCAYLTEDDFKLLAEALKENQTLQEINLFDVKVGKMNLTSPSNLKILEDALHLNTSLINVEVAWDKEYPTIKQVAARNKLLQQDPTSILTSPPHDIKEKIAILKNVNSHIASYLIGTMYNNLELDIYDPDKAFEYFQNATDYLPAQKALLPFLIASCVEEEKIADPIAFAAAQQIAADILAKDPTYQEAKAFLDATKMYGKSIKLAEEFQSIVGLPMKSITFFSGLNKKMYQMHQTVLIERKNSQDERDAQDRAAAQHEFDNNWGLIIKQ